MNRKTRRLLALGVSAMALNAVTANATTYPGVLDSNTAADVNASWTLSDLTEVGTNLNIYGVTSAATATVNSTADGWIVQFGFGVSEAEILLNNSGTAQVIASASDTVGFASANANITGAVLQWASASDLAGVSLENSGHLDVGAIAFGSGSEAEVDAQAGNSGMFGPIPLINQFAFAAG
ncbi:MAG: hypothetical protein H6R45_885, partial [Proteobacteria bacterium]|nr:hypothetical protein [Pseudomonadota bacterium]